MIDSDPSPGLPALEGWPVDKPFYILSDACLDGSLYLNGEGRTPTTKIRAFSNARDIVTDYGGVQYVVRCEVIRKFTLVDSNHFRELRKSVFEDNRLSDLLPILERLHKLTHPDDHVELVSE